MTKKELIVVLIAFLVFGGVVWLAYEPPVEPIYEEVCEDVSYLTGHKNIGKPHTIITDYRIGLREGFYTGAGGATYIEPGCYSEEEIKNIYPECDTDYCIIAGREVFKERCEETIQDKEDIFRIFEQCKTIEVGGGE